MGKEDPWQGILRGRGSNKGNPGGLGELAVLFSSGEALLGAEETAPSHSPHPTLSITFNLPSRR